jgi:hypothetical protein
MMKKGLKTMVGMFMLAMLWGGVSSVSAQSLLINFNDESSVEVQLDPTFTMSFSEGNVVIKNSEGELTFAESAITNVAYDELCGDVNRDGIVDVADMVLIINIMAGMDSDDMAPANAVPVDLGLPSHRLWANINIGGFDENDYGLYFAWGESTGYKDYVKSGRMFNWENYKWIAEGESTWQYINKYQCDDYSENACWYDENGAFIGDGQQRLLPEDDAARANWGKKWRMPYTSDIQELIDYTTQDWICIGGVWGCRFTGSNGNYIFLPAAGLRHEQYTEYRDLADGRFNNGFYWTADIYEHSCSSATALGIAKVEGIVSYDAVVRPTFHERFYGYTVRAVLAEKEY